MTVRDSPDLKIIDPDSQETGARMYTIGLGLKKKTQKTQEGKFNSKWNLIFMPQTNGRS